MMIKKRYIVRFITPAFLGDAEQNGAWRIPPFKALLRQWWRIAAAKKHAYNYAHLREEEGRLFGNAWLDKNFSQSQIKLRLDNWRNGKMPVWAEASSTISHPEIKFPIDSNLYLGYGPLTRNKETKKTTFDKLNAAIQADESNTLSIIYPNESSEIIKKTLQLFHWFGTAGGRCRNGWGSIEFSESEELIESVEEKSQFIKSLSRPFIECLNLDWPHAFGQDKKGFLIWKTARHGHWRDVMKELAKIKIEFRTAFKFTHSSGQLEQRHILAYPVTNHPVSAWGNQARLSNQLRFKVIKAVNQYQGLVYHLPCAIPGELAKKLKTSPISKNQQLLIWQSVHKTLDDFPNLKRI